MNWFLIMRLLRILIRKTRKYKEEKSDFRKEDAICYNDIEKGRHRIDLFKNNTG
jgi:hypothetical protein